MKMIILGLAAAAALAAAGPAAAQYASDYRPQGGWDRDWSRYGEFSDDVAHARQGIRHGMSDGSFTRWEAGQFWNDLRNIERLIWTFRGDGRLSGWERRRLEQRFDRLHEAMHEAHDEGHDDEQDWRLR